MTEGLEKLKRINIDKVKELFATAGITPEQGNCLKCLMAAAVHPHILSLTSIEWKGFDLIYSCGVIEGFDNNIYEYFTFEHKLDRQSIKYKLGHSDGTVSRKIIFGK